MTAIFLSYAREDQDTARELRFAFEARGANVWWDRNLLSGERYIEAILRQLDLANHVVVILSRNSAESPWVSFEAGATRMRELSSDRELLRIVHLDGCQIPTFLGERQATRFSGQGDIPELSRSLGLPEHIDWKRPAGAPDVALVIFRAGGQWMEIAHDGETLSCILVDAGEQRARIQWQVPLVEARTWLQHGDLHAARGDRERGWGTFSLGRFRDWRWTPALFDRHDGRSPSETFTESVGDLITSDPTS